MKKKAQDAASLARSLAVRARRDGCLLEADLNAFLDVSPEEFDERVDALIEHLGEVRLDPDARPDDEPTPLLSDSPRIPPAADDDNLRRYLRLVRRHRRMEKSEEIVLGKRLEFARRRFHAAAKSAHLRHESLRVVLGGEFSRSFAHDLHLPRHGLNGIAQNPATERRAAIRARAAEMNRFRANFVERSLGVVADLALCYRTYGVPVMDLIQEGNGALIRAVEKFDWRKDVRFQTYATFWIRQAVERCIAFNKGIVRVPNYLQQKMRRLRREGVLPRRDIGVSVGEVSAAFDVKREVAGHLLETERTHFSLDVAIDEDGETFASLLPDGESSDPGRLEFALLKSRLTEVLNDLSPLEREILELRFGLSGQQPFTLEEVGRRMSVSRERIRQLQVRAIRKLQRPTLLKRLAGFV